jgi:heme-degrading monooxygenase HmoA
MQYVLIIHAVKHYLAWKAVFDDAAGIRKAAGEQSYQLLAYQGDPNKVVHFSHWSSLEKARDFFESTALVEIRARAGVEAPTFIYLEKIEEGAL